MLLSPRALVRRYRHARSRAPELSALFDRIDALPPLGNAEAELRRMALDLARRREQLAEVFSDVKACTRCSEGDPLPFGRWPGGGCCGGSAEVLFTDDELAALVLAGTERARLTTPDSELGGCIFRGELGCSLDARDRPNVCVRYTCGELGAELARGGDGPAVDALQHELRLSFERFSKRRAEAIVEHGLAELERSFDAQQLSAK